MLVRELMTSPAVTIGPDQTVAEAAGLLDRRSLTSLPVVDDQLRLVGIIGEADVIGQLSTSPDPAVGSHRRAFPKLVRDVMTHTVLSVRADDELSQAVALMSGTTLKSLPVLLQERVAGMLSRRDVVRAMTHGELDAGHSSPFSRT